MNESKPFWKSKTIWVNVLAIIGGITTALSGELATGGSITGIGILNIVLRAITSQSIE